MCEEKKKCLKKIGFAAIIGTFVFSLITMVLAFMIAAKSGALPIGPNADFLISKKYDKGQSIEKALKTEKPMLVWFYTDWCGYCKNFAPIFSKVSKDRNVKKDFAIAYVNCQLSENEKYTQEYQVRGFPTVYMVKGDKKKQIDNEKLFGPKAIENIKEELKEFTEDLKED